MSSYSITERNRIYFLTSTVVAWTDVFTRQLYRDIIIDSWKYCIAKKGLHLNAYVVMSNHIHWIASSSINISLENVVRDFKKHTSKSIIEAIKNNEKESRKMWMLNMFSYAGKTNSDNENYQFWQSGNHAEVIFSDKFLNQKLIIGKVKLILL